MSQVVYPAHGWLPPGAHLEFMQDDQGKDFATNWRGTVQAPGSGVCIGIGSDRPFPSGFGPHYAVVRIFSGPFRGHDWYIGHCTALVDLGQRFAFGHPLARPDQGHNWLGTNGGWVELGNRQPSGILGPEASHHWFDDLLRTPLVITKPDPVLRFGAKGHRVLAFTAHLRDAGWLTRPFWHFSRPVHGAVVAFQRYHHLKVDGVVGPHTEHILGEVAHWCRVHHRKEHR